MLILPIGANSLPVYISQAAFFKLVVFQKVILMYFNHCYFFAGNFLLIFVIPFYPLGIRR
ncbi:hypothetical protein BH11BAC4_BH11BAC4_13400 [soil metagenome]